MSDPFEKLREALARLAEGETLSGGGTYRAGDVTAGFGYTVRMGLPRGPRPVHPGTTHRSVLSRAPDYEIQDESGSLRVLVYGASGSGDFRVDVQQDHLVVRQGEGPLRRIPLPVPVVADTLRWSVRHGVLEVTAQKVAEGSSDGSRDRGE